jgi:glycerol-3-phosphate acyltransferase PlsY
MMTVLTILLCIFVGYLLGSIPTGYWVGRAWGGIDIREHGSGSMGATNILRTLGQIPALIVLGVDVLKGSLAVVLASIVASTGAEQGDPATLAWLVVITAMAWPVAGITGGIGLLTLGLTQIVSLSSIVAALSLSLLMGAFAQPLPYRLFGLAGGLYVLFTHRRNFERLLEGTEPAIGQPLGSHEPPEPTHQQPTHQQGEDPEPTGSPVAERDAQG